MDYEIGGFSWPVVAGVVVTLSGLVVTLAGTVATSDSGDDGAAGPSAQATVASQVASSEITVHPGHSGLWHNPDRSGEGWMLELLDGGDALVTWFTYPPAGGAAGEQAWMIGVGGISGNRIVFNELVITRGPVFGPDFDPEAVERIPWGSLVIEFFDCMTGRVTWFGPPEFGSGTSDVERLSFIRRLPCGEAEDELPAPAADAPGISGNWFDPAHSGEGWTLQEIRPNEVVMTWFSYDPQGNQAWMIAVGDLEGRAVTFPELTITRGTRFGGDFDPEAVVRERWGEMRVTFDTCDSARLSYQSDRPEFGRARLDPIRLSRLKHLDCAFPPLPDLSQATWSMRQGSGPGLSELPAVRLGDFIYVAGGLVPGFSTSREFWRYGPLSDSWTRLADLPGVRDHGMMVAFDGALYFFGGLVFPTPTSSAWRYDPAANQWHAIAPMPGPRGAGAAVTLGEHIYVTGGVGSGATIHRYTPAADQWEVIAIDDPFGRDHSAAVAFQGEIWILGGRSTFGAAHGGVTIFDPLSGTTRPGPSMSPRSGFAASVAAGRIVVIGGENLQPLAVVLGAQALGPGQGLWQSIPGPPVPVHGMGAAEFAGELYLMLGSVLAGGVQNPGHVQVLEIPGTD